MRGPGGQCAGPTVLSAVDISSAGLTAECSATDVLQAFRVGPTICSAPLSLRGSAGKAQDMGMGDGLVWFGLVTFLVPVGKVALYLRDAAQRGTRSPGCPITGKRQKTILPMSVSLDSDRPFIFQSSRVPAHSLDTRYDSVSCTRTRHLPRASL